MGSREWPGDAQQSPRRRRQPQRPGRAPMGSGVGTLGPGLGLSWGGHMQMGQARLATMPSRVLHGLGHSSTQAPGLLGVAPTKGPFNRHLLGLLSIFRTLPKPRSLSSPWSGPRHLPTLLPSSFLLEGYPESGSRLLPGCTPERTHTLAGALWFRTRPRLQILALPAPLNASFRPHQMLVLSCSQNLLEGVGFCPR